MHKKSPIGPLELLIHYLYLPNTSNEFYAFHEDSSSSSGSGIAKETRAFFILHFLHYAPHHILKFLILNLLSQHFNFFKRFFICNLFIHIHSCMILKVIPINISQLIPLLQSR